MSNSRVIFHPKMFLSFLLVLALAISSGTAAFAASSSAAATTEVVIKLKLGSGQMTVDGVASTVQPPFQKNGVTFIPLSVLTKGIGAQLQLTDNKKNDVDA
ncbi:copper amine oxidase N-terminal domain-containing protein [Cohnella ginsengisoli]|uniref:Copper amine oxidase N-terminal domain-containing protein n=1 Tax=Cohnella ginsengisoli TaxID=425004 RepID=A0A9X4QQ69_9BACL|nr:stalk domain-containing protein [Cohnella ginsengisoli]MDG0794643.1 copper amine oxidase N-terminal domain-containing protein [Cohnella ginsengisoli]